MSQKNVIEGGRGFKRVVGYVGDDGKVVYTDGRAGSSKAEKPAKFERPAKGEKSEA